MKGLMQNKYHLILVLIVATLLGACSGNAGGTAQPVGVLAPTEEAGDPLNLGFPTPDVNDPRFVYWNGIPVIDGAYDINDRPQTYIYFVVGSTTLVQNYYQIEMAGLGWRSAGAIGQGSDSRILFFNRGEEKASVNIIPATEDETIIRVILNYSSGP